MISNQQLILFFIIMAFTEISAQFLIKKAADQKSYINIYFILGLLAILITYIFLYFVMKTGKHISIIHAIHHTSMNIIIALGAYFLFSQKLNPIQIFALFMIIIGTFIISLSGNGHDH